MTDVNIKWRARAEAECDWLTISPSEGIGSTDITFSADAAKWYTKKEDAKCKIVIYNIDDITSSAETCFERCVECFNCGKFIQENSKEINYNITEAIFEFDTNYLPDDPSLCEITAYTTASTDSWVTGITIDRSNGTINVQVEENEDISNDRTADISIIISLVEDPEQSYDCRIHLTQKKDINNCNCDNLEFEELESCSCLDVAFSDYTKTVCKCEYSINTSTAQLTCEGGQVAFSTSLVRGDCGNDDEEIELGNYTADECVTAITPIFTNTPSWLRDLRLDTNNKKVMGKIISSELTGTMDEATVNVSLTINDGMVCDNKSFKVTIKCEQKTDS